MKIALDQIVKRLEKSTSEKMRQLSEVREKLKDSADHIQHFVVELDEKVCVVCMRVQCFKCV